MDGLGEKKTYIKVVNHIKQLLADKKLSIGDRLPTERDLSTELQLSRNSAREALRALEIMGVVESRQGSGNYLTGNFATSIADSCAMALLVGEIDYAEVVRLRRGLDMESFAQAFANSNPARLADIENALKDLEDNVGCAHVDPTKAIRLDSVYHNAIIHSAGNRLLILLSKGLSTVLGMQMANEIDRYSEPELVTLRRAHRAIYEALRDGDYQKGLDEISAHYEVIEKRAVASMSAVSSDPANAPVGA